MTAFFVSFVCFVVNRLCPIRALTSAATAFPPFRASAISALADRPGY
jgi:hypothetical protein